MLKRHPFDNSIGYDEYMFMFIIYNSVVNGVRTMFYGGGGGDSG